MHSYTEQQYTNITFIVKRWFVNEWKRAVLSDTTDLPWQRVALRQYVGTEWETCHTNVFALMKMPPKQTYATYEKLVDLDGAIYRYLNPFPEHLEFPKEVLAENEARARKPLPAHMQHILKQFQIQNI